MSDASTTSSSSVRMQPESIGNWTSWFISLLRWKKISTSARDPRTRSSCDHCLSGRASIEDKEEDRCISATLV